MNAREVYGSSESTRAIRAIRPSRDRCKLGVTAATPGAPTSRLRTSATSAAVAAPPLRSTSTSFGASAPAGNAFWMALKPSTLSVRFLKTPVVL